MKVGCPLETAEGEKRVAMTPDSVGQIRKLGYECLVQSGAGAAAAQRLGLVRDDGRRRLSIISRRRVHGGAPRGAPPRCPPGDPMQWPLRGPSNSPCPGLPSSPVAIMKWWSVMLLNKR